jgi:hypothetical protein
MEFALTRKQLNKKREKEEAAAQGAPPAPAPAPPSGPGADPATGLPSGYDPSPPSPTTSAGSDFFGSGSNLFGQPASPAAPPPAAPVAAAPVAAAPVADGPAIPGFANLPAAGVAPAGPGALAPTDGLEGLPAAFGTSPVPSPPVPVRAPASDRLIEGARPRGAALGQAVGRRYGGFIVLLVVAILMVEFLPSFRGSVGNSSAAVPAQSSSISYLPGQTHMTAPYSAGTTVSGVSCGPSVRQVTWSAYALACQPKWSGSNGGATSPGVTGSTITLTYREAASSILQELYTLVPAAAVGTNASAIHTLQAYINVFNKSFELYGRHVVLVPYQGQGNFIDEDTGSGGPQAQSDAVTVATSLHAFADMSLIDSSVTYTQDLATQKVVTFGLYQQDQQWYEQNAPYEYTPGPNCSKSAQAIGALFGQQLKGLPAQFAKGALQTEVRKLGIFYTSVPTQAACEQQVDQALAKYGVTPAAQAAFTFDLSQLPTESATAVAQMKAAGVTTIICVGCDPISPRYYFASATSDNYFPEWYFQSLYSANATDGDSFIRLLPADQREDLLTSGVPDTSNADSEAVHAYNLGNTTPGEKIIPDYELVYGSVLAFFSALQAAGPNLTPENFQAAMRTIPQSSNGGELGGWNGQAGPYDPASSFQVLKWDNSAVSPADGQKGTWEVCNGGNTYPYANTSAVMPSSTQLACKVTPQVPSGLGAVPTS